MFDVNGLRTESSEDLTVYLVENMRSCTTAWIFYVWQSFNSRMAFPIIWVARGLGRKRRNFGRPSSFCKEMPVSARAGPGPISSGQSRAGLDPLPPYQSQKSRSYCWQLIKVLTAIELHCLLQSPFLFLGQRLFGRIFLLCDSNRLCFNRSARLKWYSVLRSVECEKLECEICFNEYILRVRSFRKLTSSVFCVFFDFFDFFSDTTVDVKSTGAWNSVSSEILFLRKRKYAFDRIFLANSLEFHKILDQKRSKSQLTY